VDQDVERVGGVAGVEVAAVLGAAALKGEFEVAVEEHDELGDDLCVSLIGEYSLGKSGYRGKGAEI